MMENSEIPDNPLGQHETVPGLISVMMPAYNAERFIGQAIDSLFSQTYANWELIVVNDGSTDDTAAVAGRYFDPRIHLVNQENGGESMARNTALSLMRGEFVAFLDADDQYFPEHLETAAGYLNANPSREGVYTDGFHCDTDGRLLKSLSSRRRGPFEGWLFEELIRASDVFGPPLCIVLRRKPILERNLSYDPRIVIGPDWDFNTRFAEFTSFGYIDRYTCLYRVHKTNITVRTTLEKRNSSLAICREKAIKLGGFARCSLQTQSYVFYELLVELLAGQVARQAEIIQWPEFLALPASEQARILRLMATHSLDDAPSRPYVQAWLDHSHRLDPHDWRITMLRRINRFSPALFRTITAHKGQQTGESPLSDVFAE
jgi:glycosyltransferase involved in cell wall biosynthesis